MPALQVVLPWLLLLNQAITETSVVFTQGQGLPSSPSCSPGEYYQAGRCCKACPAGQHVGEHCRRPHSRGKCLPCLPGTFMKYLNRVEACVKCSTCSENEEVLEECMPTHDQVCQCPSGYFYAHVGSSEICSPCSTPSQSRSVITCREHEARGHQLDSPRCKSASTLLGSAPTGLRPALPPDLSKGITLPITAKEKMPGQAGRLPVGKAVPCPQVLRAGCVQRPWCPTGHVVVRRCNATADTVCRLPAPQRRHRYLLFGTLGFALVVMCLNFWVRKRAGFPDGDAECVEMVTVIPGRERASSISPSSVQLSQNSVSSMPSNQDGSAESSVPMRGNLNQPEDSVDIPTEAPAVTRALHSLEDVHGPQAVAGEGARALDWSPQPNPAAPAAPAETAELPTDLEQAGQL
ncbi:uncharacterized protein ACBT57_026572 isoform 1-T1 [Dama dama]|uniref:uncharacterized protein LOC133065734 isoform X1 n=1 Tax=Dama dama TaxID=30532 RepID=UPI002A36CE9A|nr:uncharacterized protein LOC133065734 isoform X1 [Dama dama]